MSFIVTRLLLRLAKALIITEACELALAAILPKRCRKDLLCVFLVNIVTNPVINYLDFVFRQHVPSVILWVIFIEAAVFISEALIFRKCLSSEKNPYLFSFLLNAASFAAGLIFG